MEVKAIDLPLDMQKAMARQAQAERDKRAKIISAEAEYEAAKKLAEAAQILDAQDNAITLRYLETMQNISSGEGKTTTFFPIPINLIKDLLGKERS